MTHLQIKALAWAYALFLLSVFNLPAQIDPEVFRQMEFRFIGPEGNRTIAIAGVPGNRTKRLLPNRMLLLQEKEFFPVCPQGESY